MQLSELKNITDQFSKSKKTPLLFIGHGHPMNAILNNDFTHSLTKLGESIEKPNAILMISAHWETVGTYISTNPAPKTIYDFGRFDDRLFQVKYEPKGAPELAKEVIKSVNSINIVEDKTMGLDHGAWTVLKFIYPKADVPVFQMSLDYTKPTQFHYELGKELKSLREKGVLIISSGNIVHNLGLADWHNMYAKPHAWNVEFDEIVKTAIDNRQFESLINYQQLGLAAKLSIPTNDHYLPLMYSFGLASTEEPVKYLYEGFQNASISMRCFQIG